MKQRKQVLTIKAPYRSTFDFNKIIIIKQRAIEESETYKISF